MISITHSSLAAYILLYVTYFHINQFPDHSFPVPAEKTMEKTMELEVRVASKSQII